MNKGKEEEEWDEKRSRDSSITQSSLIRSNYEFFFLLFAYFTFLFAMLFVFLYQYASFLSLSLSVMQIHHTHTFPISDRYVFVSWAYVFSVCLFICFFSTCFARLSSQFFWAIDFCMNVSNVVQAKARALFKIEFVRICGCSFVIAVCFDIIYILDLIFVWKHDKC